MTNAAKNTVELPELELLQRFDVPGPRYTSYPTADRFKKDFDGNCFSQVLSNRGLKSPDSALSLYVHIPFCHSICYYCGCNKEVTKDHSRSTEYIETLGLECDLVAKELTGIRTVEQLHFGGGSPTFLNNDELTLVMKTLTSRFPLEKNAEVSIEVDPRTCPPEKVQRLADVGFNRMSVGVQDFDERVQIAVNRLQPYEQTKATVDAARQAGFKSINMDLIYGLPLQTESSFSRTLDKLLTLSPDRVALYHYAHLPERFKAQRRINTEDVPDTPTKVAIMMNAIRRLAEAGYHYIGMDHFAKTTDELAKAQEEGTLQRNFQGYSTKPECDMVALGVSAISKVGNCYAANPRELQEYYEKIRGGTLATARGYLLTEDDQVRYKVIMTIMCQFEVIKSQIELQFGINFDEYFAYELNNLRHFEAEGLVALHPDRLEVLPKGKLLVRAVAMNFDRYLREDERVRRYSRIV